jgi:N-acetylmuramoyl-L-alanine amidase
MTFDPNTLADWLPGYPKLEAKHFGGMFMAPPNLVVLHRPALALNVAEYFHNNPDGRIVSTHFGPRADGSLVQCVSLRRVAWGQGGSVWKGDRHLNARSISIECPCPMAQHYPTSGRAVDQVNALLRLLASTFPSIVECIDHHDGDPNNRRDVGPEFPWQAILDGVPWSCHHLPDFASGADALEIGGGDGSGSVRGG